MKVNLTINVTVGIEQQRSVRENGTFNQVVRKVRVVYGNSSTPIGFIRNAQRFTRRAGWVAYNADAVQIGIYTRQNYAIDAVVEARL